MEVVPQIERPVEVIPHDDFKRILTYLQQHPQQYVFIKFLYLTGFRKHQAIALRWEFIDFENNLIQWPDLQLKKIDLFPLSEAVRSLLLEMGPQPSGKVFIYSNKKLNFWYRMHDELDKNDETRLKKRYTPHQLRKTFITDLLESGMDLRDVADLAGHKDMRTTKKHYAFVDQKRLKSLMDKAKLFDETKKKGD